jgi:SAM-dependent methyltransferase
MSQDDARAVSEQWSRWRAETDLEEYYSRWRRLEATGQSPHGEADFIESLHPRSVLDAGCGMGRVATELDRRGIDVVGVDLDDDLLAFARRTQPAIRWLLNDLASMDLGRCFDVVAMPGNVMIFCRAEDRAVIIRNLTAHLEPDGLLVAGFQLDSGEATLGLEEYDGLCRAAGLELVERWATWDREPYSSGTYAVSVHRPSIEPVSRRLEADASSPTP